MSDVLDAVVDLLAGNPEVLFITGAGMSADSGLPTYRGIGGLYEDASVAEGMPIEVALSGPMFRRRPDVTWKYIKQIEAACRGAGPNDGHRALAALERHLDRVWVLTQNVDGLHDAAGSQNVIPIHGDVHNLHCTRCTWEERVEDYAGLADLPTCPSCEAIVRPRVVLFEEMLPSAGIDALGRELAAGFDLVVIIGTTAVFPYIAGPVFQAARAGLPTVEINPGRSEVTHYVQHRVEQGAAEALTAILRSLGIGL
ncbi:MAG: NAD-dependent deacylase [Proteobacteria bacterium]|nr:NAD-dependent deacylase [Pseudomonadota bacterium]